ncbi:MAG TPA: prephenate dehydratase [Candidatus Atribacteria bacterium]|nr:MAG: Chorismate mutase / prephenate dehydratase [Atribacteria bacterium 34_128]HAJ33084.1 prephenate dehydratase [Candidatus Atribacteria bacterium]
MQNRVAFQGERGAFSEIAALKFFRNSIDPFPCKSFSEVFKKINNKEAKYGILPIENSQTGGINEVHDLLLRQELFAVGEVKLKVEHCLITKEEIDFKLIERVYSHPQALAQCEGFLSKKLPHCQIIPVYDTAGSVKIIKEVKENNVAAIASNWAAELYGLKILGSGIQDNRYNYTRFLVLSEEISSDPKNNKTSIIFAVVSKPGALYRCLKEFALRDINLNRLESRPSKREPWEYIFYTDFEKGLHEKETQEALKSLEECTTFIKIIGSYYSE